MLTRLRLKRDFRVIVRYVSDKPSDGDGTKTEEQPKTAKETEKKSDSGMNKIQALLKTMKSEPLSREAEYRANFASAPDVRRQRENDEIEVKVEKIEESIIKAAGDVAQAIGGDVKQTEADLLSKVLGKIDQKSTKLSDLLIGMKVERSDDGEDRARNYGETRGEQVKRSLRAKQRETDQQRVRTPTESKGFSFNQTGYQNLSRDKDMDGSTYKSRETRESTRYQNLSRDKDMDGSTYKFRETRESTGYQNFSRDKDMGGSTYRSRETRESTGYQNFSRDKDMGGSTYRSRETRESTGYQNFSRDKDMGGSTYRSRETRESTGYQNFSRDKDMGGSTYKSRETRESIDVSAFQTTTTVDIFGGNPLNIFKGDETNYGTKLRVWKALEQREVSLATSHQPANYFQKMILWTEQGKVWKFPINNEQGLEEEANVHFSEHIFLDTHLEGWCPTKGPIRHFMELVCVGLSKNPFYTAQEKKDHIMWYKEYFESKKDVLTDVGAWNVGKSNEEASA